MQQSTKLFGSSIWTALVVVLMLVVAACVPISPPAQTPAPEEQATEQITGAVTETVTATVPAEEESGEVVELSGVLTGTVMYLQRVALPEGSVIEVSLRDVSRQDVAATEITSQTITTAGEQVPIPFELTYDPARIDPRMTYALNVRITIDGQLSWINTEQVAVLTRDAPVTGVEVMVQQVQ